MKGTGRHTERLSDGAYAPFGEPYSQSGTADPSFTGQRQDTVAGLYDFPAREYSYQGRWSQGAQGPRPAQITVNGTATPLGYACVLPN